jgi:hypothetical protein
MTTLLADDAHIYHSITQSGFLKVVCLEYPLSLSDQLGNQVVAPVGLLCYST